MGDFLRHLLLRPMGVQKAVSAEQRSSRLPAPLARYRPEYPFPSCVPAELESVFPGTYERTTFQRLLPNHWTQERMPAKIHRPVPRLKDRNRTSPLPLKSKKNQIIQGLNREDPFTAPNRRNQSIQCRSPGHHRRRRALPPSQASDKRWAMGDGRWAMGARSSRSSKSCHSPKSSINGTPTVSNDCPQVARPICVRSGCFSSMTTLTRVLQVSSQVRSRPISRCTQASFSSHRNTTSGAGSKRLVGDQHNSDRQRWRRRTGQAVRLRDGAQTFTKDRESSRTAQLNLPRVFLNRGLDAG